MNNKFYRLKHYDDNTRLIIKKKPFSPAYPLALNEDINFSLSFAYEMTFGQAGEHRDHRSGGKIKRTIAQIFFDAFQGKLAEFFFMRYMQTKSVTLPIPDTTTSILGSWDKSDFKLKNLNISIKSTKYYSQLLLLECKDFNNDGLYIHGVDTSFIKYDYVAAVRIRICDNNRKISDVIGYCSKLFLQKYSESQKNISYNFIKDHLLNNELTYQYDIPGFITNTELKYLIANNYKITQGTMFGSSPENLTKMDADNYYAKFSDLDHIDQLAHQLRSY